MDLLSTDEVIDATCYDQDGDGHFDAEDDTVVVNGRDLCEDFAQNGKVECVPGYRIRLNGTQVCPSSTP
ncbi:MAG: hypothetical protein R3F61_09900 [Myxococcota bacterium]